MHVKHNNFESETILPMIKSNQQPITQCKRLRFTMSKSAYGGLLLHQDRYITLLALEMRHKMIKDYVLHLFG